MFSVSADALSQFGYLSRYHGNAGVFCRIYHPFCQSSDSFFVKGVYVKDV